MKKIFTFLFLSVTIFGAYAQNPSILFQNTIGGSQLDSMRGSDATVDGGTVVVGVSTSNISGDKTENSNGGADVWVVKLDTNGAIEWQNTIGGSDDDIPESIEQTIDGGYILGVASNSNTSGDKTEDSRGESDFWIIKLDNIGNIEWQRTYGGSEQDATPRVVQTTDGGYIASGFSDSNVSGDKTDPSNGQRDIWVIKIDSSGAIEWQNSIGGSTVDRPQALLQVSDGGYLTAGLSDSNISGDKTEANIGSADWWVVKLDVSGNVMWDNTIGGNGLDRLLDAVETADNGFLLGGHSQSGVSGDKTEPNLGGDDYWVIKLDNVGMIQWQNTIGGNQADLFVNIMEEDSGNILASGFSISGISGDKTDANIGGSDLWLVRLDAFGNLIGQNTLGGTNNETFGFLEIIGANELVISTTSNSSISGDKTEASEGLEDYWILKVNTDLLGFDQVLFAENIKVYPNPTTGAFSMDFDMEKNNVSIESSNVLGQLVSLERYDTITSVETLLNGPSGIYFVTVKVDGSSQTEKIIKQ